jgi:hypothetical protein
MSVLSRKDSSLPIERAFDEGRKPQVMLERSVQICAAVTAFIFLITGIVYVYLGSYPATHADFWSIYEDYFRHSWIRTAALKDGGTPLFFPNLFWLTSVKFFDGSQQPLIFIGLALLFITAALLLVPVWRDETVGLTMKIIATMAIIVGNFWMGRWAITLSGGFNSENSLAMAGVALALVLIPKASHYWPIMPVITCAGFIASFSFGTGFAIWPTLLLLAWCLRLRSASFITLGVSTLAAIVIYELLPPHSKDYTVFQAAGSSGITLVAHLCRLIGSPVLYATVAWQEGWKAFVGSDRGSMLVLWSGMVGLVLGGIAVVRRVARRDLGKSSLEIVGLGLIVFNVGAMTVIIAGRIQYFHVMPSEVMAPRYVYWSSLFWTGLFLVGMQRAERLRWGRRPMALLALAIAVFAWPEHYRVWFHGKTAQCFFKEAATAVISGVVDDNNLMLSLHPERIARVAPQLRAHRLDMFADGLQDWIGLSETSLFGGRRKPEHLQGRCRVSKLLKSDKGAPAARIVGHAVTRQHLPRIVQWLLTPVSWVAGQKVKKGYVTPKTLVVIDPKGVVRGVARSCSLSPVVNGVFYHGAFSTTDFLGYIRDYDPQLEYVVRSAHGNALSEETIAVQPE